MTNMNAVVWPLPQDDSPPLDLCLTLQIPNRADYYRDFISLLSSFTYWYAWDRDPMKRGKLVAQTWQRIVDSIAVCEPIQPQLGSGGEDDCMCCLRVENGVLQQLVCGVWEDVSGQPPGGFFTPNQPGAGTEQPPAGGGCVTYHGSVSAAGKWLIPTIFSTGDTIEIHSAVGAGNDGIGLRWYCPDGSQFIAGVCVGATTTDGADPLPSDPHMALIARSGSHAGTAIGTAYTVPSGVTNAQYWIQVNDGDLTDNDGNYTFDVTVCNNAAANFHHVFNFAVTQAGWISLPRSEGGGCSPGAIWTPGVGWTPDRCSFAAYINLGFSCASTHVTHLAFAGNLESTPGGVSDFEVYVGTGGGETLVANDAIVAAGPIGASADGPWDITGIRVRIGMIPPDADFNVFSFTVDGTGPDPF